MAALKLDDSLKKSGVSFARILAAQKHEATFPLERKLQILKDFRKAFNDMASSTDRKPNANQIKIACVKIAANLQTGFPLVEKLVEDYLPEAFPLNKDAFEARSKIRGIKPRAPHRRRKPKKSKPAPYAK